VTRPIAVAHLSLPEYLKLEAAGDGRHEFLDGDVYAMAGGTPEHGALALAIAGEIRDALRGKPCRVYSSDVRVRIRETGLSTYPDLSVVCGSLETDEEDRDAITNPVVLVEVLSDSTEAYDRGAKAAHYRRIPSLREYVFVAQDARRLELYRLNEHERWELVEAGPGEKLKLSALGIEIEVDRVYENPLDTSGSDH
jgi:Uma2 family endonuclease